MTQGTEKILKFSLRSSWDGSRPNADAAHRMPHHKTSRQILTFCDGEMKSIIKFAIGERDELITESLKHFLTSKRRRMQRITMAAICFIAFKLGVEDLLLPQTRSSVIRSVERCTCLMNTDLTHYPRVGQI